MKIHATAHHRPATTYVGRTVFAIALVCGLIAPAYGLEFFCAVKGDERFIRLELPGEEHLCEVSVTNRANERRVMWYADNDSQFCSAKAYELRDKYVAKWNFSCSNWPDTDGIDKLNARQRKILDSEIKSLIARGASGTDKFRVSGVKAASSADLNQETSAMALQFFLAFDNNEKHRDLTYVIIDNGKEWEVLSEIDQLANHIDKSNRYRVSDAIISSITDAGAIEITTSVIASDNSTCQGNQVLHTQQNGTLAARTPHRYVCG